jgi:hypothetical protein
VKPLAMRCVTFSHKYVFDSLNGRRNDYRKQEVLGRNTILLSSDKTLAAYKAKGRTVLLLHIFFAEVTVFRAVD